MFDFFREMGEELIGIDSELAKKERQEKREKRKLNRFIFSKTTKVIIIILAVIYVAMVGNMIATLKETMRITMIIKCVAMSIDAIVVAFALIFGKKKGEIVALVGSFIFVLGLFFSVAFF